jgi:hypothetical protein
VSATQNSNNDEVHDVYSLPSVHQSIKYLHAMARFPTGDEWLDAIKAGKYTTLPYCICQIHEKQKSVKLSPLQAQTHYSTYPNPERHDSEGFERPNTRSKRPKK